MKSSAPDTQSLRLAGTMLRFVRALNARLDRELAADLNLTDLSAMAQVTRGGEGPSAVAEALQLDRPRVTRVIEHLVNLGLVERTGDPADRRRLRLSLTPAGELALQHSMALVSGAVDDLLAPLAPADREGLLRGVGALREVLERPSAGVAGRA